MSNKLNDWSQEGTSTIGQGDLILSGVVSVNQTRFRDGLPAGEVYYSISDGANREAGIGTFNGTNNIVRSQVHSTLVSGTFSNSSPSPIPLSGGAVVSGTFNTHAYDAMISDLASLGSRVSVVEGKVLTLEGSSTSLDSRVTVNESDIAANAANIATNSANISTVTNDLSILDDDVAYREVSITALEHGSVITQNGPSSILVAIGGGEIIDSYTDTENQGTEEVSWVEQTLDLIAAGGMPLATGLGYTTIGVESSGLSDGVGVVKAYPNGISSAQRKIVIVIGHVEYIDRVLSDVRYSPVTSNQIGNVLMDLIDFVESSAKMKGLVLRPTNLGTLTLWRDSGTIFGVGANYANAINDQNVLLVAADGAEDTAITFKLVSYNNGTTGVGAEVTLVPNDLYEPAGAGTIDTVSNGSTTIHYFMETPSGHQYVLYGQKEYATHAEAVSNLFSDRATHLFPAELDRAFLLAQLVVDKNVTAWGATAEVFAIDSSTSSGSAGGSASQAVNISYSDTYNLGNNVQSALDTLAALKLTPDQHGAVNAANAPTGANPFVVQADIATMTTDTEMNESVGAINNPLMHMPLLNSLAMTQGQGETIFSRASLATYIDRYGVSHVVDDDTPRFDEYGLLMEKKATNQILLSATPSTFKANVDIVTDTQTLPTIKSLATLFKPDVTSANHYFEVQRPTFDPSLNQAYSVKVKPNGIYTIGRITLYGDLTSDSISCEFNTATLAVTVTSSGLAAPGEGTVRALADGWYLVTIQGLLTTVTAVTGFAARVVILGTSSEGVFAGNGDGMYVGEFQVEQSNAPSTYVPSSDVVGVREAENITITAPENVSNDLMTVVFDYVSNVEVASNSHVFLQLGTTVGQLDFQRSSSDVDANVMSTYNANYTAVACVADGVTKTRVGVTYDGTNFDTFSPTETKTKVLAKNRFDIDLIRIISGSSLFHISNLRLYDFPMTLAQRNLL